MNTIFLWIPKNAGTSVYTALKDKIGMKLYMENYREFDNRGSVTFGHLDIKEIMREGIIEKNYWQEAKKFIVVRNPYSRVISLYNDFLQSKRIPSYTTLKEFLNVVEHYTRRPSLKNVIDFSQASSQVEWVVPGVEIVKFEKLKEWISINYDVALPHENKNTDDNWMKYYDKETLKIATNIYYDGFVLFNYEILV